MNQFECTPIDSLHQLAREVAVQARSCNRDSFGEAFACGTGVHSVILAPISFRLRQASEEAEVLVFRYATIPIVMLMDPRYRSSGFRNAGSSRSPVRVEAAARPRREKPGQLFERSLQT